MVYILCLCLCLCSIVAEAATYALTISGATEINGVEIDGGGTYAGINITGTGVVLTHASVGNVSDDALNVAESASVTDSAFWCGADADCTITVVAAKTLTGSTNAVRVAPSGAGTNSWTDTVTLAACPYASCTEWDMKAAKKSPLLKAATSSFTDSLGKTGTNIGYWQNVYRSGRGLGGFGFGLSND